MTCSIYISMVSDKHTLLYGNKSSSLPQYVNEPDRTTRSGQKQFEEHDKEQVKTLQIVNRETQEIQSFCRRKLWNGVVFAVRISPFDS